MTALPCVVTIVILICLFGNPQRRAEMGHTISHADWRWLVMGLLGYGLVEFGGILRWFVYLRIQGSGVSFPRASALFFIGLFFNSALPGSTGGDAIKLYYLMKETKGRQAAAFLSIVMDRMIGFLGLALISSILIASQLDWLRGDPTTAVILQSLLVFLGVTVIGIILSFFVTGFGLIDKLPARLPGRGRILQLAAAYNLYGRSWPTSLLGFFISLPVHIGYFGVFYCAARALRADVQFAQMMAIMPVVAVVTSIPISFGGVGVREVLFREMLGRLCGIPDSTAILIGSTGYLMIFFWSMVGGLVYPFYRPSEAVVEEQPAVPV
jgi:uncharacterized membrane protein YbhN (UPF0104 family)